MTIRDVLKLVKQRIHYIGMPQEPKWNNRPDWRREIAAIESALSRPKLKGGGK